MGEQSLFNFWLAVKATSLYHGGCMFAIQAGYKKHAQMCLWRDIAPKPCIMAYWL